MKMYEVSYDFNYNSGTETEVIQATEQRLNSLRKSEAEGDYYSNVKVLRDLGEKDETWIPKWLEIAKKNMWICEAYDPPCTKGSFSECKTVDYLISRFKHGNWCLGQAFYYKNICFINQVDGGDEWLTIREGIDFESFSCGYIIEHDGEGKMKEYIDRILKATDEQLESLDY